MRAQLTGLPKAIAIGLILTMMGGCPSSGEDEAAEEPPINDPVPPPGGSNDAPAISGSPSQSVTVGNSYSFTPTASDPDGDPMTFSIENMPDWATFSSESGQLSGTPEAGDVSNYTDITITVTDGSLTDSLDPFSISVDQVGLGSATLSWNPPTQNSDGTSLNDLSGYRVYYGPSEGSYPNLIEIDNPGLTTYVVENLSPGTYYFVTTAVNSDDVESAFSNVSSKSIN
jgi:hypothetical protein